MKAHKDWSYKHYYPKFFNGGDIHVCRIAPDRTSFSFDWLNEDGAECEIYMRPREIGSYALMGKTTGDTYEIGGLIEGMEYEFYVKSGDKRSRTRLVRLGEPFNTVINYLHPQDEAYSFSGRYLCSPSLVRHPDGYLLSSMDVYAHMGGQNLSMIFRSDDDGKTWKYLCQLFPCFWAKLFVFKGEVYATGISTEYGDLLIGKSIDGGENWGQPTVLLRGGGGKQGASCIGCHMNPQPDYLFEGRIYHTLEWGSWNAGFKHAVLVMSAPEDSDLLDADSWSFSEPVLYNPNWPGVAHGASAGNIEGALCEKDGNLYNIMRYDMTGTAEGYGKAIKYKVNTKDFEAPMEFVETVELPANHSKFMIRYHEGLKKYLTIATRITEYSRRCERKVLSLMASDDLKKFDLVYDIVNNNDKEEISGFQYVWFFIEGNKILYQCRTAINRPNNHHDSNYATFGTIDLEEYFPELKK